MKLIAHHITRFNKYVFFGLIFLLPLFGAYGQDTFTSTTSGDWNDGGTWGNTSPGVAGTDYPDTNGDDFVIITTGFSVTLQQAENILDLTINSGGTLNAGANTLTIDGDATLNGTFNAGTGTVIFDGVSSNTLTTGGNSFFNVWKRQQKYSK